MASELSGHTPGNDPQSTDDAGRRKIAAPFKLALAAVFPAVALAKDYSPELPSERSSTVKAEDDTPADRAVPHPEKLATPVDVGPSLESTVTELELPTLDVDEPANLGVGATVLDRDLSPRDLLALDVEDLVNVKIVGVGSARGKSLDELVKSDLKELLSFGEVQAPHGDEIDVVNLDLEGLLDIVVPGSPSDDDLSEIDVASLDPEALMTVDVGGGSSDDDLLAADIPVETGSSAPDNDDTITPPAATSSVEPAPPPSAPISPPAAPPLAAVGPVTDSDVAANGAAENASNGAAVGITALATDLDGTDAVSYSLTDDAGGRFAIDATTGVITVADNTLLDYETTTSHDVTVLATSDDGSTSSQVFTVNLTDDADTITGTAGDDVLNGTPGEDIIYGLDGDDAISGLGGNDILDGGAGTDTLNGGAGDDILIGGPGGANDTLETEINSHTPVAYWRLGEGLGTSATDETGNHGGTYQNGVSVGGDPGPFSGISTVAAVFDGSNDHMVVASSTEWGIANGTISMWFNVDNVSNQNTLLSIESSSDSDGVNMRVKDDFLEFNFMGGGDDHFLQSSAGTISANTWYHVTLTWGGSGLNLYLDGALVASDAYTGGLTDIGEPVVIGASQKPSDNGLANNLEDFFDGTIAEVAVFDTQLVEADIDNVIDSGVNGSDSAGDVLDGGTGTDTVSYEGSAAGVTVDLDASTASGGDAEGDTLISIENMIGSANDDTLTGDAGANTIEGGDGDDILSGAAGNDIFVYAAANTGSDTITDFTQGNDAIDVTSYGLTDINDLTIVDDGFGNARIFLPSGDDVTLTGVDPLVLIDSDFNF